MGVESRGGGGRIGEGTGGIMPGSEVAHFHREMSAEMEARMLM